MFGRVAGVTSSALLKLTGYSCDVATWCIDGVSYALDAAGNYIYSQPPEEKQENNEGRPDVKPFYARLWENTPYGASLTLKGLSYGISALSLPTRLISTASKGSARLIEEGFLNMAWDSLKSAPRPIADNPFFSALGERAADLRTNIDAFMQQALEPALYSHMSDYAVTIKEEKYQDYQPSFQDDPLYFYANIRLLPAQLAAFLPIAGKAIDSLNTAMNEASLINDRLNAIRNLITLIDPLNETYFKGVQPTFEQLRISDIPFQIPEFEHYRNVMEQLLPVEKFINMMRSSDRVQTLIQDLFQSNMHDGAAADAEAVLNEFFDDANVVGLPPAAIAQGGNNSAIDRLIEIISNQVDRVEDEQVRDEAKEDIHQALAALSNFDNKFREYSSSDKKKLDLVMFLISSAPAVYRIIQHGSQAYSSLANTFHDDYLKFLNEINAFFKDTCLQLDNLEINALLKEGYFRHFPFGDNSRSLHAVMEQFSTLVAQETGFHNNYDFPEENQFPYCHAILKQREERLAEIQNMEEKDERLEFALDYRKTLVHNRVASAQHQLTTFNEAAQTQRNAKNALYFMKRNDAITLILASQIARQTAKAQPHSAITARRKLALLQALGDHLSENKSFDEAIDAIKHDDHLKHDLFLLWTGSTRATMKNLENICLTRDSYISHVREALSRLQHMRQRKSLFSPETTCMRLAQRIEAMQELLKLMENPGHRPSYALEKLNARNPAAYSTLNTYDKTTIDAITDMEKTICNCFDISSANNQSDRRISSHIFGKILIGFEKPDVLGNILRLTNEKITLINDQIEKLQRERNSFLGFFSRSVKDQKIRLLGEIREKMQANENTSLHQVISDLNKDAHFRPQMYQLHQSRTGRLLRELCGCELSREEILRSIDQEIARLSATRTVPLFFFRGARKQTLEAHISALQCLKTAIENPENNGMDINILYAQMDIDNDTRHLLENHSRCLLEKIGATLPLPAAAALLP